MRFLEDEEEPEPCAIDPETNLTEAGETEQDCIYRRRAADMTQTTIVFLGVLGFIMLIGVICAIVSARTVKKNFYILFGDTWCCKCCCQKKEAGDQNDGARAEPAEVEAVELDGENGDN